MNIQEIISTLKIETEKVLVLDFYNSHIHNQPLPSPRWSLAELDIFKSLIIENNLLSKFYNLEYLDLTACKIEAYPDLKNLNALRELHHTGGKFNLPESLGECTSLNKISLSCVVLTKLPKSISRLQNLEQLKITQSNLKSIQKELSVLSKLSILDFSQNKIDKIVADLSCLNNLENLKLYDNKIQDLPEQIYDMPNLKYLDLSENPLFYIDVNKIKWKKLEVLNLRNSPFGCFKSNIENLIRVLPNCEILSGSNGNYYEPGKNYFYLNAIKRNLVDSDYHK